MPGQSFGLVEVQLSTSTYVIRGGLAGRERLRMLARVLWPTTKALFEKVGVPKTARCLDVGCGGGDVTRELARLAPNGHVTGIDLDAAKLELAQRETATAGVANVTYRREDLLQPMGDAERYDLIYVRFVLSHLPDPGAALAALCARLAPGGVIVVEDTDFSGHFCHPDSAAFRRYLQLYAAAVTSRGGDPDIGPRLPALLGAACLTEVGMNVVQPAGISGEAKLIGPITLEAIADSVLAAGLATPEELNRTVDALYAFAAADGTLLSLPRIVQAWGRRS
jgi:SAM-dependent methyltransferase